MPKVLKVIIAGGRNFDNYFKLEKYCDALLVNFKDVEVISGKGNGADLLGEQYAGEKDHDLTLFLADWDKHGKAAGPIRNRHMAEYADALIAFWDGKSKGTKNMIMEANKRNLMVKVVYYA